MNIINKNFKYLNEKKISKKKLINLLIIIYKMIKNKILLNFKVNLKKKTFYWPLKFKIKKKAQMIIIKIFIIKIKIKYN